MTRIRSSLLRLIIAAILCGLFHNGCAFQSTAGGSKQKQLQHPFSKVISKTIPLATTTCLEATTGLKTKPSKHALQWEKMYALLSTYVEREGNVNVPGSHKEDGENLGAWLSNQHVKYKSGKLLQERQTKLESIGIVFGVDKWEQMMNLLVQYSRQNGHCRVPQRHKEDGMNLGTWLNTQRQLYRVGKLDLSKQDRLEEIGVTWNAREWKWDEMMGLLVEYKEREGDCMVPQNHKEAGENLGKWVDTQRHLQRNGDLDGTRKTKLEEVGMIWDVSAFHQKEMMIGLRQYKKREGDCQVPSSHMEDGKALGSWLNRQRRLRATGKLDPSLSNELEDVGVIWSTNDQKWEIWFGLLQQFQKREGHCRVPQKHQEGKDKKNLGNWLDFQRHQKKNDKLDATRESRLEEIGVEWEIYAKFGEDDDDDDWGFEGMDDLFDDDDMYS